VPNTSPDVDRLKRGSSREGCSLVPPKPDPSPCFGVPPSNSATQNSHLCGNGAGHNRAIGSSAWLNYKQKCWKVREGKPSCVLTHDIAMDRVIGLSEKALVGKFYYSRMNKIQLSEWILRFWKPLLGYYPRFSLLSNHWLVFHFLSKCDLLRILGSLWIIGRGVLMLKRWYPGFNPLLENFTKISFWMLLPDFPIEFWSVRIFKPVANSVGKFIFFDEQSLRWSN
jgi:hypothetical protein